MTRIYTSGDVGKPLRSAEIKQDDISELISQHTKAVSKAPDDVDVILRKELDPLLESHAHLELRATTQTVSIGHTSHDGWDAITSYDRERNEWYTANIYQESCYIDPKLKYLDLSLLHDYDSAQLFAESEFVDSDGKKWLELTEDL